MGALWRIGEGRVGEVRGALPERYRSAYTTVQTVLNRLSERGLLSRERAGSDRETARKTALALTLLFSLPAIASIGLAQGGGAVAHYCA